MSKYNRVRLTPEDRKQQILNAAVDVALKQGLYAFSISNVARSLQDRHCSKATIRHYFTMEQLRSAVILEAVESSCQTLIGEAVAMKHPLFDEYDKPVCQEEKEHCLRLYLKG